MDNGRLKSSDLKYSKQLIKAEDSRQIHFRGANMDQNMYDADMGKERSVVVKDLQIDKSVWSGWLSMDDIACQGVMAGGIHHQRAPDLKAAG